MRIITLDETNKVISVKDVGEDYVLAQNDIATESGEHGQIMQPDGTFITPEPEPTTIKATIEELILAENIYQTALLEMNMMG